MRKILAVFITATLVLVPGAVAAQSFEELDVQDLRLARIADAMMIANAPLCRQTMPVTGLILHSADQYRDAAATGRFGNGSLAVSSVVAGSPAALAGLQQDDGIVAINGQPVDALVVEGEDHLREVAFAALADTSPARTPTLLVSRDGALRTVSLDAPRGCRALVEILLGDVTDARSNGRVIQVAYNFTIRASDDEIALLFAHELAHSVLEHRRRKVEAGIDNDGNLFAQLGRNQRANRQAEVEADRLSVHLLANAGYDPAIIATFWRTALGHEVGGGAMPSFIYPSQEERAQLVELEIARYLPFRRGPTWPGHLLERRTRGFDTGN